MALSAGEFINKYEILDHLGSGNFGDVYQVHDVALDTTKAIKILGIADPRNMKEIYEAQILQRCRHENCVHINEANVFNVSGEHKLIIDMEYLPEGSLEKRMQEGFVSPQVAIRHISHVLYGLGNAHHNGVLHRDVKPANILLSGNVSKLSDFGLATLANGGGSSRRSGRI